MSPIRLTLAASIAVLFCAAAPALAHPRAEAARLCADGLAQSANQAAIRHEKSARAWSLYQRRAFQDAMIAAKSPGWKSMGLHEASREASAARLLAADDRAQAAEYRRLAGQAVAGRDGSESAAAARSNASFWEAMASARSAGSQFQACLGSPRRQAALAKREAAAAG